MYEDIKNIRLEKGMLLKDVSNLTGISISYLSKIERGQVVPSDKILKIIHLILGGNWNEGFKVPRQAKPRGVNVRSSKVI